MSVTDMIEVKVIAITGASSGIGEAAAVLLAERGARLVLGARREDRLTTLAARTGAAFTRTDVTRREDLHAFVGLAQDRYGRLDVLINNAGIGPISPLDDLRVDEWDAMVDVNVKGVLHGIAAALPVFRAQGSGHFVNTASTAAHTIRPAMAVYSATKISHAARSRKARARRPARTCASTVIMPGMTDTGFADDISNPEVRAQIAASKTDFGMPPAAIAHAISASRRGRCRRGDRAPDGAVLAALVGRRGAVAAHGGLLALDRAVRAARR